MAVLVSIISNPVTIIGLTSLLGLILSRSSVSVCITGFVKSMLGFMILQAGAGIIVQGLIPFSTMFSNAFNLTGVIAEDNSLVAAVQTALGYQTAMILIFSFVINLILARITKLKYIFLTGHMMFSFAGTMAIVFDSMGLSTLMTIILGSIIQGISMIVFPALAQKHVRKVVGNNSVAFGFWGSSPIWISGLVGKLFGNPQRTTEDLKVPKSLGFIRDMAVLMSVVMIGIYLVTGLFTDKSVLQDLAGTTNSVQYLIFQALTFVIGILILLQGVRMFLAEIIPAFKGIAEKLVPGAIPALDVPIFYAYAPVAVTVGFIFALLGGLLATFLSQFVSVVVLPSVIGLFFMGAAAGVFGNAYGGRIGAMASGFVLGFVFTFAVALAYPLVDVTQYGVEGLWFASTDAIIVVALIKLVSGIFGLFF